MGTLIFNGISTADLGLVIQAPPAYSIPKRDYTVTHVPGRSGDVIVDNNSYSDANRTYSIAAIYKKGTNFVLNAESLSKWLHSAKGYARLEDSYDPEVYRLAVYADEVDLQDFLHTVTVLNATFKCKPQRFLKSGEEEVMINDGGEILNPTKYPSKPLLKFKVLDNNSESIIQFTTTDGKVHKFTFSSSTVNEEITFDSELMECYNTTRYLNEFVTLNDYEDGILLEEGVSTVSLTNIEYLKIIPRWWSL